MISKKIRMFLFAMTVATSAVVIDANAQVFGPGHGGPGFGRGPGHGGPGWGRGPGHGPGRPGPGYPGPGYPGPGPGRPGPGYPGPGYPPGHGGGWNQQWYQAGTQCGPMQPWGTSLQCPTQNPTGMNCNGMARGTKCFGSAYWQQNYACTSPYNGQTQWGTYIFSMYTCN